MPSTRRDFAELAARLELARQIRQRGDFPAGDLRGTQDGWRLWGETDKEWGRIESVVQAAIDSIDNDWVWWNVGLGIATLVVGVALGKWVL